MNVKYLEGEAYFEVAKDKEHPFKVMAQGVEVNVLGTHFNVNAYPERTDVVTTLVEGKVRVGRGTRQIVLVPGEQADVVGGDYETGVPLVWGGNGVFRRDRESCDFYGDNRQKYAVGRIV